MCPPVAAIQCTVPFTVVNVTYNVRCARYRVLYCVSRQPAHDIYVWRNFPCKFSYRFNRFGLQIPCAMMLCNVVTVCMMCCAQNNRVWLLRLCSPYSVHRLTCSCSVSCAIAHTRFIAFCPYNATLLASAHAVYCTVSPCCCFVILMPHVSCAH